MASGLCLCGFGGVKQVGPVQDGEGDVAADVSVLCAVDLLLPDFILPLALVGPAQAVEGVGVYFFCACVCGGTERGRGEKRDNTCE